MTDLDTDPPGRAAAHSGAAIRSYVAIGDSITEGMNDPGLNGSFRGFADRLAELLAESAPGFRYANLAVRGRRIRHIFGEQLEQTLNLAPELVTVNAGGNDVLRPGTDLDKLAIAFEKGVRRLREAGMRVLIISGHDTGWIPFLRMYRGRVAVFSMHLRAIAERHGCDIVDLWAMEALNDPRAWSEDRLHLSSEGHRIVALRTAELLGHPTAIREMWARPWSTPLVPPPSIVRRRQTLRWTREYLMPWIGRRAMGRSSGDGRVPKRPDFSGAPDGGPNGSGPLDEAGG